jgi:hypothetical protein
MSFLITACSPHPASGVWESIEDNDYGIETVVMSFSGRANFTARKLDNVTWHCFWSAKSKQEAELTCTPSTDTEKEEIFTLTINDQGLGELKRDSKLITLLTLLDENPSPDQ